MANLIDIKRFPENVWEVNKQLRFFPNYSELYKKDKSKDKHKSSNEVWCIVFMEDPDPENLYYRLSPEDRLEAVKEFNKDFDPEEELTKILLERYSFDILDSVERSFKSEVDSLVERAKLIRETKYTLEDYERDVKGNIIYVAGKPMKKPGTASELDKMRASTLKIYEQYEQVKQLFDKNKGETRIYGGRKESLSERGFI